MAAGDFNGDGRDDLAIGVPGEDVLGSLDAGAVNIIYGSFSWSGLDAEDNEVWYPNILGFLILAEPSELSFAF